MFTNIEYLQNICITEIKGCIIIIIKKKTNKILTNKHKSYNKNISTVELLLIRRSTPP